MTCPICHQDVTAEQEYFFPANDVDLADAHRECAEKHRAAERATIEAETVAAILAIVESVGKSEYGWCMHHAEGLKGEKRRIPVSTMHVCAANQSRAMAALIKDAIERGEWKAKP